AASVPHLTQELASPSLTRRLMATNALSDRGGADTVAAMKKLVAAGARAPSPAAAHALWVLHRLGAGDVPTLRALFHHRHADVRGHVLRVVAETSDYTPGHWELATAGLTDPSHMVRRTAAEALRSHPQYADVRPLLKALEAAGQEDTHLAHVLRMAI